MSDPHSARSEEYFWKQAAELRRIAEREPESSCMQRQLLEVAAQPAGRPRWCARIFSRLEWLIAALAILRAAGRHRLHEAIAQG